MGRPLLIIIGGLFVVFGIVQNGMFGRTMQHGERSIGFHSELHAENIANGTMDYAVARITDDRNWRETLIANNYADADVDLQIIDIDTYTIELRATARYGGKLATAEVQMQRRPLSYFAYFTDIEQTIQGWNLFFVGPNVVSGVAGEVVNGPLHTNGRLNIAGSPTFNGPVTSTQMWHGHGSFTNNPEFNATTNWNAPREYLHEADFSGLHSAASTSSISFNTEVELEFLPNGDLQVLEIASGAESTISHLDLMNNNGLIHSTGEVHVKGTINGPYTLYATENVNIIGDLVYSDDPLDNPFSEDMLGIVSEKNVWVERNAHQDNGNQHLEVQASIVALGESFGVENYDSGSSRGELRVFGGLIQVRRAPVATFSGSGYAKNYNYDERFFETVPPYFPRQNFYSVRHWMTFVTPDPDYQNPI